MAGFLARLLGLGPPDPTGGKDVNGPVGLTDYDPFRAVAIVGPEQKPSQLGAAAQVVWHGIGKGEGGPLRDTQQSQEDLPATPVSPAAIRRTFRLDSRNSKPVDDLFVANQPERTGVGTDWTGVTIAGSPTIAGDPEEHGPNRGRDNLTIGGLGGVLPGQEGVARRSPAALGATNAFTEPEPRQVWHPEGIDSPLPQAGYPGTERIYEPTPYAVDNERLAVPVVPPIPLDRPRAGAAEPGQGRPAQHPIWLFSRPFDKWAADNLTGQRGMVGSPRASTPVFTTAEAAGKQPASGMTPLAVLPNTWRQSPQPWDTDLVDSGNNPAPDAGIAIEQRRVAAGWR